MSDIQVSFVVIGRNEEAVLERCLRAIVAQDTTQSVEILYVDSASTDRSVEIARSIEGVRVLQLDDPQPNAAKGRNLGWRHARGALVQFVDGDAVLTPEWTRQAVGAMAEPDVGAVSGWLDEIHPDASLYNRFAHLDWPRDNGEVGAFGGIAMVRRRCLEEAGGFPEAAQSGEEPLLALEMRRRGYRLLQLPTLMARHDIDLHRFGAYWRRCVATGVSLAEQIRGQRRLGVRWHQLRTVKNAVVCLGLLGVVVAGFAWSAWVWIGFVALFCLDLLRIGRRHRARAGSWRAAIAYAAHCRLIAVPQAWGFCRWVTRGGLRTPKPTAGAGITQPAAGPLP